MRLLLYVFGVTFGCALGFGVLQWLFPMDEHQPTTHKRRGVKTDAWYWFVLPIIDKLVFRLIVILAIVGFFIFMGWTPSKNALNAGFGPVLKHPKWLQVIEAMIIADFAGYWIHRWFHTRKYWKYHAIHHSSPDLDWLGATRLHPVNAAGNRIGQALSVALLGFPPTVLASWVLILTLWDLLIHANLNWSFGPLKYFFASPVFHRWHHTTADEAQNKNFAGMFPFWDVMFGTFYMPKGKVPTVFGVSEPVPEDFVGQVVWPFTKAANIATGLEPDPNQAVSESAVTTVPAATAAPAPAVAAASSS